MPCRSFRFSKVRAKNMVISIRFGSTLELDRASNKKSKSKFGQHIRSTKNLVEREKKSAKRKELLSISYMVMHAISKRYFLPMVIASIIIGFTECFSRRVWH